MKTESDLMQRIREGEIIDLKLFFESFFPQACRFARKFIKDYHISKDITQDSFLGFWMNRKEFNSVDSAKNYIYASIKNRSLNYIRDTKKFSSEEIEPKDKDGFFRDVVIENETYQLIYDAIHTLSPQSQRVIEFSLDGFKNPEIAKELGISVNTVKTIKLRAFEILRKRLKKNILIAFLFFR